MSKGHYRNCKIAIAITWIICAFFCIPLIFSHGEVVPAEGLSYCGFMNNQTIPFLPDDWDMRWNQVQFTVIHFHSKVLFILAFFYEIKDIKRRLWECLIIQAIH